MDVRRVLGLLLSLLVVSGLPVQPASAAPKERVSSGLVSLTPTRVIDTRTGLGTAKGLVKADGKVEIDLLGRAGLPTSGVRAVVVNLTVTSPQAAGYAEAYPGIATRPAASTLNYVKGQTVANQAIVQVPGDGHVAFYTSAAAHLLVDVTGYYFIAVPAPYVPLTPGRILDTRIGTGSNTGIVSAGGVVPLKVTGVGGVPTTGVGAVALNVTDTGSTAPGFVSAYPAGLPRPGSSVLNYARGSTVAGMTIAKVGANGTVDLYTSARSHLLADVIGWLPSAGSDYVPLTPARALDTRTGAGRSGLKGPVGAGGTVQLTLAGTNGVPSMSATHPPATVEITVTATATAAAGYVSTYPSDVVRPSVSTLNYVAGDTRANASTVKLSSSGAITLYTSAKADLIVDVVGYFVTPTPALTVTSTTLAGGQAGHPYTGTLQAAGGVGPYTWSAETLPDGLTLDSATGTITGTPTVSGTSSNTVTVTDSEGVSVTGVVAIYLRAGVDQRVTQISTGYSHSCAVLVTGVAECWGSNRLGELGDGTFADRRTPVPVLGLGAGVTQISAGENYTCAVLTTGAAKCWGLNNYGQLGDGTGAQSSTPVQVSGLDSGVKAVSAKNLHTCAVLTSGKAKCWGWNDFGQLGVGDYRFVANSPVDVSGLSGVASISVGSRHTCAVLSDAAAWCWGSNYAGELGSASPSETNVPVKVPGLSSGVASAEAGSGFTCVLLTGGTATCWGANNKGQLGTGSTDDRGTPATVSGLQSGVAGVTSGDAHACAVLSAGGARCWGDNTRGQLGDGSTSSTTTPITVLGLGAGATDIASGANHTCALLGSGAVQCWGANEFGELGDLTRDDRLLPVTVDGLEGTE